MEQATFFFMGASFGIGVAALINTYYGETMWLTVSVAFSVVLVNLVVWAVLIK